VQHSDVNADVVTIANSRVLELGSTYTEVVKRLQIEGHQQTSVRIKGLELLVDSSWRFYSRYINEISANITFFFIPSAEVHQHANGHSWTRRNDSLTE